MISFFSIGLFLYIIVVKDAVVVIRENDVSQKSYLSLQEIYYLNMRVKELEEKLETLSARVPKKYAEVKFLNYLTRKRILVCILDLV